MQPFNVSVFDPLKHAMSFRLDPIFRTDVCHLYKAKWIESYIKAWEVAITPSNIHNGWRSAGLFPMNKHCILHQLFNSQHLSTPLTESITSTQFLSSISPPDHNTLQSANIAFNTALLQTIVSSLVKTHAHCLAEITVQLTAENAILMKDNSELWAQIRKQKERVKGKRLLLKNTYAISMEEVYNVLAECKKETKKKKRGGGGQKEGSKGPNALKKSLVVRKKRKTTQTLNGKKVALKFKIALW